MYRIVEENLNEANELWEKGEFGKANLKYGKSVLITFPFVREMIKVIEINWNIINIYIEIE